MQLVFQNVSYTYAPPTKRKSKKGAQTTWAVKDISFSVNKGDFLAIAGRSGSGKSTLALHMNGLLNPTKGTVLLNGESLTNKNVKSKARKSIGLVFQYPETQLFATSVFEDVAFGPRNIGFSSSKIAQCVEKALEQVDLNYQALKDVSPFTLSGGQQRRVALAGVLAMQPAMLVLDEPTAGLDPAAQQDFLRLIKTLHQEGITIVMISHNMNHIAALATKVLVLNNGEIAFYEEPEKLFARQESLQEIGLDIPHVQHLAHSLQECGFPLENRLYTPELLAGEIACLLDTHAEVPTNKAQ